MPLKKANNVNTEQHLSISFHLDIKFLIERLLKEKAFIFLQEHEYLPKKKYKKRLIFY